MSKGEFTFDGKPAGNLGKLMDIVVEIAESGDREPAKRSTRSGGRTTDGR